MTPRDELAPVVFVVDDDAAVRVALSRLFRSVDLTVEAFESCEAFLERPPRAAPACLVLDVSLPGLDGPGLQRRLAERRHPPPIVFLTGRGDIPMSVKAMKEGAVDFLPKPASDETLLSAVHAALARDRAAWQVEGTHAAAEARMALLTARELEVLRHVIAGKANKRIGADLGVTEKTVKVHRGRAMAKLRAQSVAELVRMAELAGVHPAA